MASLREWTRHLLEGYAADLPLELVAQKRRLLDVGEQALVAQDLITFGLRRHDLSPADLDTARDYAQGGAFGQAGPWLTEQIDRESART